jgi:hypothetical protein
VAIAQGGTGQITAALGLSALGGLSWAGAWIDTTTYAQWAVVFRSNGVYVSVLAGNVNHDPAADDGTNWALILAIPSGHVISSGAAPTIAAGTDASAATIAGNDTAGTISATGAAVGVVGTIAEVTFATPYAAVPNVVISPLTVDAATCAAFVTATETGFTISNGAATAASVALDFSYSVTQ